jgi:hypothetical protein
MKAPQTVKRIVVAALLSGGVVVAGLGASTGIAHAGYSGPYTWCPPGQGPSHPLPADDNEVHWNQHICHTFYSVDWRLGNVYPNIYEGDNPPGQPSRPPFNCGLFYCPDPGS